MRAKLAVALAGTLILSAVPMLAHHSVDAEFDRNKPITVTGTVTKLEWANPHIWFYLDAKDEQTGKIVKWQFEGGPPNALRRNGVSRDNLKEGDVVTVRGILAKKQIEGVMTGDSQSVTFANGKRALTRDAAEDNAGK